MSRLYDDDTPGPLHQERAAFATGSCHESQAHKLVIKERRSKTKKVIHVRRKPRHEFATTASVDGYGIINCWPCHSASHVALSKRASLWQEHRWVDIVSRQSARIRRRKRRYQILPYGGIAVESFLLNGRVTLHGDYFNQDGVNVY